MKNLSVFMALALTLLAACKSPTDYPVDRWKKDKTGDGGNKDTSSLPVSAIIGKEWRLTSFEEFGKQPEPVPVGKMFTINFHANGNAGGMADCNSYGTVYRSEKPGSIHFSDYISTLAVCGPLDARYSSAIIKAESYWTDGKSLLIEYDNGSKRLNYELSVTTQQPNILADSEWQLESFETFGQAKQVVPQNESYTLSFDAGNRAYGQINCNSYVANYAVYVSTKSSGIPIRFTNYGSTDQDCGKYTLAAKFEEALTNATEFLAYQDQLTIEYNDPGMSAAATRMNFVRLNATTKKNPLMNTSWLLIEIDYSGTVEKVNPKEIYTLEFAGNQEGKGLINCNEFMMQYTAEADASDPNLVYNMSIAINGLTKKLCPSNLLTDEYMNGLSKATHYRLIGNALTIYYTEDDGTSLKQIRQLRFTKTN